MKILICCDKGINRSVVFASHLKFWQHDTIAIGLDNTSQQTLTMLYHWADVIILTEQSQKAKVFNGLWDNKITVWDVGPDTYPRPYNPELLIKVKNYLETNRSWLRKDIEE